MTHRILFLDFETYYDDEYSLRKMAPPNYILDPRFECIGLAAKEGPTGMAHWVDGPDVGVYLKGIDPTTTTTITFNALFDNCILAWRYNFVPSRILCAMRMAVAMRGHMLPGASLATVGKSLGVGTKGTTIDNVKGLRRADIIQTPGLWRAFQAYGLNDVDMCAAIFDCLIGEFPRDERRIMDMVLRCAIEPRFVIDKDMLAAHMMDLDHQRAAMLLAAGVVEATDLRSGDKFADLLRAQGIEPELKPSLTQPNRMIYAFAKTDEFMAGLQEHEDPLIQALAAARLGVRSTIEQTRGQRILSIANLDWSCYSGCKSLLPVPLRYSGAHTHRLSGDWKINLQNLPSGRGKQKSKLRKALLAPPGHKVVVADKSQIECRINAWICGQDDLLALFATGADPYSVLASSIFERPIDKKTDGGIPRFIGKSGELGLGFGCGDTKFYNMVVRAARVLGMDMQQLLSVWTPELASKSVRTYRATHGNIVQTWRRLDDILDTAWCGLSGPAKFGPCEIGYDSGTQSAYVEGPSGLRMWYYKPHRDDAELRFRYGKRIYKMYGSKFLENIVQFLARINTMADAVRIADRGYPFALQSHDELAWIVPETEAQTCLDVALEEMKRAPAWALRVPFGAEGNIGVSYGDAK